MLEVARLTTDGALSILGELDQRLPIVTDGLLAHFPFDNTEKGIGFNNNLGDSNKDWIPGNNSPWGSNGASEKTSIILEEGPFGKLVPVMRAINTDVSSTADGGWTSKSFTVDPNFSYMIVTWVKRVVKGDGTFYFGVGGNTVRNLSNGELNGNPYMEVIGENDMVTSFGRKPDDGEGDWILVVGVIQPWDTANGSAQLGIAGTYAMDGEKISACSAFKWAESTTISSSTRSYLYYDTTVGGEQWWAHTGIFKMDGSEPTLDDLLNGRHNTFNPQFAENLTFLDSAVGVEPAKTNYIPGASEMESWGSYSNGNDGTFLTEFGTIGYKMNRRKSWNGIYKDISVPVAGKYTFSAWFRYIGGSNSNNGATVYLSGYGGGDTAKALDKTKVGEWQRIHRTIDVTDVNLRLYIISYGGDSAVDWSSWEVTMPKFEAGEYPTDFHDDAKGSGKLVVDFKNDMRNASEYTVAFKYRHESLTTFPSNIVFATSYDGNNPGQWIGLNKANGYKLNVLGVDSPIKQWNTLIFVRKSNGKTDCYLNGNFILETDSKIFFDQNDLISFSSMYGWNSTTYLAGVKLRDLSVYKRALSSDEVNALMNPKFIMTDEGDLIVEEFDEYVKTPMRNNLNIFPFHEYPDEKFGIIEAATVSNVEFFNSAMWVGEDVTNMYGPISNLAVIDANGTLSQEDYPELYKGESPIVKVTKIAGTPSAHASFRRCVTVVGSEKYQLTFKFKILSGEKSVIGLHTGGGTGATDHSLFDYLGDGWYKVSKTVSVGGTTMCVGVGFVSDAAVEVLITEPQLEYRTFETHYTDGTRPATNVTLPYDIIDCKQDFTIFGFWYPKVYADSAYRPCLTRNLKGIANSTYNRILIMGNGTTSRRLRCWISSDGTTETSIYAPSDIEVQDNEWNFFCLKREGTTMKLFLGNSTGFGKGEYASTAHYLNEDEDPATHEWIIGRYYSAEANAYFRDYHFRQDAMTDADIENIFREKMKQYTNKLQILQSLNEGSLI